MLTQNSKRLTYLYLALVIVGLIILFHKYLLGIYLFLFVDIGNDTINLFYPSFLDDVRTFREEGIPFWSFAKGIGQSNFSPDFLSPFRWIYLIVGVKYLAYAIAYVQFTKAVIIAIASYHLFKIQGIERRAALVGSSLVAFMGYAIVGSSWYGHTTNIMFMLLFLLGMELWFARKQWWLLPVSALFLLGPALFFILEFTFIYLFIRLTLSDSLKLQVIKQFVVNSWRPILAGILIASPFLADEIYGFIYSPRVSGVASYAADLSSTPVFARQSFVENVTMFFRFLSNDLLGTGDGFRAAKNYLEAPLFYCGLASLLLFTQVFIHLSLRKKIAAGVVLAIWAIILIFPYFRYAFYLFQGDYYKSAISMFVPLTMIWFTVISLDRIFKGAKINFVLLGLNLILITAILFLPEYSSITIEINTKLRLAILIFLSLHLILLVGMQFLKKREIAILAFMLLVLVEGIVLSYPAINERKAIASERLNQREFYNDYAVEALDYIASIDPGFYRVEKTFGSYKSGLNDSQGQGFFDTKSYRSHNHKNYVNFFIAMNMMEPGNEPLTRWMEGLIIAPELHPLFQMKYVISRPGEKSAMLSQHYNSLGEMNGLYIHKNKNTLPFGFTVDEFITELEFKNFGTSYYRKLNALYTTAVIPAEDIPKYPGLSKKEASSIGNGFSLGSRSANLNQQALQLTNFKQSDFSGTVNLDRASMMIFSMPYDAGWKAYVDGKRQEVGMVHNGLTGVYLEPGSHVIRMKYRPPFFSYGVVLFVLGIGLLVYWGRKTKNSSQTPFLGPLRLKEVKVREKKQVHSKENIDLKKIENKKKPVSKKKGRKKKS